MNILFIGDVFGNCGKRVLSEILGDLLKKYSIDVCIANGENIAGGKGITSNLAVKLKRFGVDIITSGNHIWDNKEGVSILEEDDCILRPLNYPVGNKGNGSVLYTLKDKRKIGVINVQGRTFMYPIDCPFRAAQKEVLKLKQFTNNIIIDFHAEATSEKKALAYFLDGRITSLIGTHTHVQTADETILPKGTSYISDAGMTGPHDSVIGMKHQAIIEKFLYEVPVRFEPSSQGPAFNGVLITSDDATGKTTKIKRIIEKLNF